MKDSMETMIEREAIQRAEKAERELAAARDDIGALVESSDKLMRERDEARATIVRIKALVERWRSRYGTSRDACADELEVALDGPDA